MFDLTRANRDATIGTEILGAPGRKSLRMARRMAQKAVRRLLRPIRDVPDLAIFDPIRAQIQTRSQSSWIWFLELLELILSDF